MNMTTVKLGDVLRNTISNVRYTVYSIKRATAMFPMHIGIRKIDGGRYLSIEVPKAGVLTGWEKVQ